MEKQDHYLVYRRNDGTLFYYKNKKLHREAGPAIVSTKDSEKYNNIGDDELYKKTSSPVIDHSKHKDGIINYISKIENDSSGYNCKNSWGATNKKMNGIVRFLEDQNTVWQEVEPYQVEQYELAWNSSAYFLEGKEYTEEKFKKERAKILTKQLGKELPTAQIEKSPKLKL